MRGAASSDSPSTRHDSAGGSFSRPWTNPPGDRGVPAMSNFTRRDLLGVGAGLAAMAWARPVLADAPAPFALDEVVDSGHRFFGGLSRGFAEAVQEAARRWGLPNGYILGQEASAAFVGGLRYGEGEMYTRNAGDQKIFWQGPSVGFDAGVDGDRTMMLVYNLPAVHAIFQRFGGIAGSAYFIGGFGFTALNADGGVGGPLHTRGG